MILEDLINEKLESEDIYQDTTVIVQTTDEEVICALSASDLLESDADCLTMDVTDSDIDDDENLVVVVE